MGKVGTKKNGSNTAEYKEFEMFDALFESRSPNTNSPASSPTNSNTDSDRYNPTAKGVQAGSKSFRMQSGAVYLWTIQGKNEEVKRETSGVYSAQRRRTNPIEGWRLAARSVEILQFTVGLHFKKIVQALDILDRFALAGYCPVGEYDVYNVLTKNGW